MSHIRTYIALSSTSNLRLSIEPFKRLTIDRCRPKSVGIFESTYIPLKVALNCKENHHYSQ